MSKVKVITNNVPRGLVFGCELTRDELEDFDFVENIETARFVRYKGQVHYLGDFIYCNKETLPADSFLVNWDGHYGQSYFSGILLRYADNETVVMGHFYQ